jgi:coenzyme F420-reducing hydrogenase beta subunit
LHPGIIEFLMACALIGIPHPRTPGNQVVARSKADILAARGVKPTLSPNLNVLATVEALDVKRLLFIGVGCQVQALRSIEPHLGLEKLYVLGTNCVDNGPRQGLEKFLSAASADPGSVLHYEFMQDYKVHIKHTDGSFEYVPYFCLPANDLNDVIAPSCYSCFDYPNATADLVVGYMGVPFLNTDMTSHLQYLTVRNEAGQELLDAGGKLRCRCPAAFASMPMAQHPSTLTRPPAPLLHAFLSLTRSHWPPPLLSSLLSRLLSPHTTPLPHPHKHT